MRRRDFIFLLGRVAVLSVSRAQEPSRTYRLALASPLSPDHPFIPPGPPISLESQEWARDFDEIKDYGRQNSVKRTPQQTETARFWLTTSPVVYFPFVRQLVSAKQMSVIESARFMALASLAMDDTFAEMRAFGPASITASRPASGRIWVSRSVNTWRKASCSQSRRPHDEHVSGAG